jgi:hypothetical protein
MSRDRYPESAWVFYFMKKCTKCDIEKELVKFYKDSQKKDGLTSQCKDCIKDCQQENKNRIISYRQNNKDYYRRKSKEYYLLNAESIKKQNTKWNRENYHKYDFKQRWRSLLQTTLKYLNTDKDTTTQNLLGFSARELKEHLDKQGMDWNNHHIDHKIPLSWFKKNTPPYIVNDLRNLQPLTEKENKKKLNRFGSPINSSYIPVIKKWLKKEYVKNIT